MTKKTKIEDTDDSSLFIQVGQQINETEVPVVQYKNNELTCERKSGEERDREEEGGRKNE